LSAEVPATIYRPATPLIEVTPASFELTERKDGCSVYEVDFAARNLFLESISLDIADPYFNRGYELLGHPDPEKRTVTGITRKTEQIPWRHIDSGVLYRVTEDGETKERTLLSRLYCGDRYLRLRIFDGDSPPLNIRGATGSRPEILLVFDARADHTYTLYGGNPKATPPVFDLRASAPDLRDASLPRVVAGEIESHEPQLPFTERHPALLWAAIGVAAILMAFLALRGVKL
jgi:hypothetical protein